MHDLTPSKHPKSHLKAQRSRKYSNALKRIPQISANIFYFLFVNTKGWTNTSFTLFVGDYQRMNGVVNSYRDSPERSGRNFTVSTKSLGLRLCVCWTLYMVFKIQIIQIGLKSIYSGVFSSLPARISQVGCWDLRASKCCPRVCHSSKQKPTCDHPKSAQWRHLAATCQYYRRNLSIEVLVSSPCE